MRRKTTPTRHPVAVALIGALAATTAHAQTVNTRIGTKERDNRFTGKVHKVTVEVK